MSDFVFVMLAGGSGTRLGWDIPKQFIRIAGKTLLEHSMDCLTSAYPDARIVVVAPADLVDLTKALTESYKGCEVIIGGSSRQGSTAAALKHLSQNPPKNVIIHEAARPFLNKSILHNVVAALENFEAVDVAIPATDTIIVENNGLISSIPQRNKLWRGQTPQAFRFKTLFSAYQQLTQERLEKDFTDDCGVILAADPFAQIKIVMGAAENIKITEESDLVIADELFRLRYSRVDPNMKGIDVKGKCAVILGGTSGIGRAIDQILSEAGCNVTSGSRATGCDIRRYDHLERLFGDAAKRFGSIDFVINTAGTLLRKGVSELDAAEIADQIVTNFTGALNTARAAYPYLAQSRGMLVNFSSSSYTRGRSGYVPYSASKAAIVNMTQGLADEWQNDGIRVNCIVPGRTDTEMRRSNFYNEDTTNLLSPFEVALTTVKLLNANNSGMIIRV
jgi:ribitol-5-phosphate 2-dehydrogenase (NADP+) / D-ribitol-5-phosphate cytidylyltransferase